MSIQDEFPPEEWVDYQKQLRQLYTDLRARAVEMERALAEIAMQHLADEMDDHTSEHADWQGGYEEIVKIAREALAPAP